MVGEFAVQIGTQRRLISTYADDIKLVCTSEAALNATVYHVKRFLARVGLEVEVGKSKVVVVGDDTVT